MNLATPAIEIVKKLYEAYDRHDHEAVRELYSEDATHDEVSQSKTKRGAIDIADGIQKLFGWLPDISWQVKEMVIGEAGTIAVIYVMRASAPRRDGTAERQPISLRGVQVVTVEGGLIRHSEDYWDAATFQRQLS
jgi:steroid delta-isomerase-like uncharacterized protein